MTGDTMRSTHKHDSGRDLKGLETPRVAGFRAGMSSSGIIGHRLGSMFSVPAETPREMDTLLSALDRKVSTAG